MKYKVLRSFSGYYMVGDKRVHITAGNGEIIDLPAKGHDFVKAGLIEKVPGKRSTKKAA
jgi:hypothetical protein